MPEIKVNDNLVCVCGFSGTGKSASLRNLKNPKGVMYLNTEAGKKLPFRSEFKSRTVTDPLQIKGAFAYAETKPEIHTIVIDSLVFMMNMYESLYVLNAEDKWGGWGEYAQFFMTLMQQNVAESTKNVIFTSHVSSILNESDMVTETLIKVKGALMNVSVESYFSCIVSTKKISLNNLDPSATKLLTITEEDEMLGFKHVFQTRLTKETINERIRSPMGMWSKEETYIDNDVQLLMNRLHDFYK